MPRHLQTDDADARDYVQFRGRQTSVTEDRTGVHFGTEHRHDMVAHRAYPVVDPDADMDDVPDDAILRPVAEQLVEQNPMVAWGVACEVEDCSKVFDSPRGEASHYGAVHGDGHTPGDVEDDDVQDQSGADEQIDAADDGQSVGDTEADGGEA